jgi:hypothetical protein
MMFRNVAPAIVVLAVTTVFAQAVSPISTPGGAALLSRGRPMPGRRGMSTPSAGGQNTITNPATMRQRMQDMEGTLAKMHAVLKQMRAKAASNSKDPLVKANLDMWELMVGHLDKQLKELQVATAARDSFEARRAALYKQADAKADAAAEAARKSGASLSPARAPGAEGTGQSTAGQTAATQTTSTRPASSSSSPN